MMDFNMAVEYVLKNEGGLTENPNDAGGITNFGISLRFLQNLLDPRKYYFLTQTINTDTIRQLTREQAKALYKGEFWDAAPFQSINNQANCNFIFDMAVNMGISPAIKCAQRACWGVLKDRHSVIDDGILGNHTLDFINHCGIYLLPAMRSERAGYYRLTIKDHPNDSVFLNDWLDRTYEG